MSDDPAVELSDEEADALVGTVDDTEPIELIEDDEAFLEPIWNAPPNAGDPEGVVYDPDDADHEVAVHDHEVGP